MKSGLVFLGFICLLTSCYSQQIARKKTDKAALLKEIQSLEAQLLVIQDATKAPQIATTIINKSLHFAKEYPKDSQGATWLFKSGDIARGSKRPVQAIEIWQQLRRDYPSSEYAPKALFAQGFTADADLADKTAARQYYQSFLSKYPQHEYTGQVRLLLSVIGETSEELIQKFKKN